MKLKSLTILTLASVVAVSSCGKHATPAKAEQKQAAETAAEKKDTPGGGDNKTTTVVAPTEFTAIGGETPASKLFASLSKLDGKTDVAEATLPLLSKKFQGEYQDEVVLAVVETIGDNSKMKLDNLMGDSKLWSTSVTSNTKAEKLEKKSVAAGYKLTVGDQAVEFPEKAAAKTAAEITGTAIKLEKDNAAVYTGVVPTVTVDISKVANLVLDLGKDPVAEAIALTNESKDDCFIVAKNEVVPAGLILTKIINGKAIDFSKLDKAELAKIPADKEMAAYFVCGSVETKEDNKLTAILFAQKPIKLTIKAAAAPAAKKEEAPAAKK